MIFNKHKRSKKLKNLSKNLKEKIANKIKLSSLIIILLMASVTLMTVPLQPVQAQLAAEQPRNGAPPSGVTIDSTHDTRCFLAIRPDTIGIGQVILVTMWINPAFASNDRFGPDAFEVTITKPDGDTDVFILDTEPATAAIWFEYSPDVVGQWKIKADYLGTYFPAGRYIDGKITTATTGGAVYGSAYYRPSSAPEETFTVQEDMVWSWPAAQLPTDYWTRPVSLNNREWWTILGNYPSTGYVGGGEKWDELYPDTNPLDSYGRYNFNPWVTGPNSAHIVWKRQGAIAGITGGMAGQYGTTGSAGNPSVVYAGRCYQTMTVPINGVPTSSAVCYDLRTGEQYYAIPGGVTPSFLGYIDPGDDALATGTWSVELMTISGGRLLKINPLTGAVTTNISFSPLSTGFYCTNNHVLSLQDFGSTAGNQRYRLINWTTAGTNTNFTTRIVGNITWPWNAIPNQYVSASGICTADFNAGIASLVTRTIEAGSGIYWGTNISAASLITGQVLWTASIPTEATYSGSCVVSDHGKTAFLTQNGDWMVYDLQTGKLAYRTEKMAYPYGEPSFGAYAVQSAYGMFFRQSYDGVYAFNWTNGKIVWKYVSNALAHFESPYAEDGQEIYPFNSGGYIADGKMYVSNTEHTPSWPRTRGWRLHCIDIFTGEGIWNITGEQSPGAIVDGYLTAANSWDGHMYVYGKGKSATTVTAPDLAAPIGSSIVIKGTVFDISPAQPNTPCVSKESMTTQMEYLHSQMPIAGLWNNETITGVPVSLDTVDPNGNYIHIGDVTTDGYSGAFGFTWEPEISGQYIVTATFMGDDSYGSSFATTFVGITEAPAASPTPTPVSFDAINSNLSMTVIGGVIAIIIAVALATLLILRKRP
jgi:hypothetical protein